MIRILSGGINLLSFIFESGQQGHAGQQAQEGQGRQQGLDGQKSAQVSGGPPTPPAKDEEGADESEVQHKGNIREVIKKLKPQQSRKIISVAVTCFCGTSAECLLRRNDTAEKAKRRIADQMQMPLEEILAVLHDGKRLETDGGKCVWDSGVRQGAHLWLCMRRSGGAPKQDSASSGGYPAIAFLGRCFCCWQEGGDDSVELHAIAGSATGRPAETPQEPARQKGAAAEVPGAGAGHARP